MPLTLHPELRILDRPQIERHLEGVRARRMVAAITYHQGVNAKFQSLSDKLERRLIGHYEMLGKELNALDRAIEKVERRAGAIEEIRTEHGLTKAMMIDIPEEE